MSRPPKVKDKVVSALLCFLFLFLNGTLGSGIKDCEFHRLSPHCYKRPAFSGDRR